MTDPVLLPILDLIEAFRRSKTMFAAVQMGVFDFLSDAPAPASAVAAHIRASEDTTGRLLDACVSLGLLARSGDKYLNLAATQRLLCRNSPETMTGYIHYSNEVLYPMWGHLEDAIREGGHRWEQAYGKQGSTLFDHFFSTDEKLATFVQGMHGFGMLSSASVVKAFDLSRFRQLCDLGGATGHLTIAACEQYPHLRGTVFDLPRVIPIAQRKIAESSAHDRIDCVPGDFFQDALPTADLYAVGRILHDWSEPRIHQLLDRIFQALPAGGGLLIAEKLMDEDLSGPVHVHMQSLNMLICTEGRERSLDQYRDSLTRAGFSTVEGSRTGCPVDAIFAGKS